MRVLISGGGLAGLTVAYVLAAHDHVNLLLKMESFDGIDLPAMWDDVQFGRNYGSSVHKFAIVGDQKWGDWLAKASRPFYAQNSRHFLDRELDSAWSWVRG